MKCISRLLLAASFAAAQASHVSAADNAVPQNRVVVATVFSQPIYADELEPDPSMKLPSGLTDEQRGQRQVAQRNERLSGLIYPPLVDQYCRVHDCEPTDEEIAAFNQHSERSEEQRNEEWKRRRAALTAELQSPSVTEVRGQQIAEELKSLDTLLAIKEHLYDGMTPEQRAAVEASKPAQDREIGSYFIRMWKFNKALYQQYGGRVIFQQFGIEPLDAYRAWLQEHERNGDFIIHDTALREQFWDYFLSEAHNFVPIDKAVPGLTHPWEKPWWLMEDSTAHPQ